MKIFIEHNGERIEHTLTRQELSDAFYEQQHNFDMDDVRYFIEDSDWIKERHLLDRPLSNDEISDIAYEYRNWFDESDTGWAECLRNTIKDYLEGRKQEGGNDN